MTAKEIDAKYAEFHKAAAVWGKARPGWERANCGTIHAVFYMKKARTRRDIVIGDRYFYAGEYKELPSWQTAEDEWEKAEEAFVDLKAATELVKTAFVAVNADWEKIVAARNRAR